MSKLTKKYEWLNTKPNSAKTAIAQAERVVPHFAEHMAKFDEQVNLKSYAKATVFTYSRAIAQVSLYFKKSPLYLDPDEVNAYLHQLKDGKGYSDTYFKHAVYGLRFFFRIHDLEDRLIQIPSLKKTKTLPVVFSREELRRLFKAPQRLKQRVLFGLIYSAGLRVSLQLLFNKS